MKKNMFGEIILQKGDDVGLAFMNAYDTDVSARLQASFIELDPTFGWTCIVSDDDGNELQAHDFTSEQELRDWLREKRITADT